MLVKHFCTPCAKTILPRLSPSVAWKLLFPHALRGWMAGLYSSLPLLGRWVTEQQKPENAGVAWGRSALICRPDLGRHCWYILLSWCYQYSGRSPWKELCATIGKSQRYVQIWKAIVVVLHTVTKTSGYQIFSHCLQLPCSAIAADPQNLFNPLT